MRSHAVPNSGGSDHCHLPPSSSCPLHETSLFVAFASHARAVRACADIALKGLPRFQPHFHAPVPPCEREHHVPQVGHPYLAGHNLSPAVARMP
eukprot:364703-Chlamydomonas_euryale.AAC.2